jgi:hypothetical protein
VAVVRLQVSFSPQSLLVLHCTQRMFTQKGFSLLALGSLAAQSGSASQAMKRFLRQALAPTMPANPTSSTAQYIDLRFISGVDMPLPGELVTFLMR